MDRKGLAAAVLLALAAPAHAALVTRLAPSSAPRKYAAVPEILRDLPTADPCADADKAVYALESSILWDEAQYWAYLMKRGSFRASGLRRAPGAEISSAALREVFYKELAAWYARDEVPEPAPESVANINDTAMRIRLVRDVCAVPPSA